MMEVLPVVFVWAMVSLLYFSKEISKFMTSKGNKRPVPARGDAGGNAIFGESKTDPHIFLRDKNENNTIIDDDKSDYNKNISIFAAEKEEKAPAEVAEEVAEEVNDTDDFEDVDLASLFDMEFGDDEDIDNVDEDSGDAASEDEALEPAKNLGELHRETLNLLKVIGDSYESAGEEEKLRARETLYELQGTDLFSQVESATGASKVELMRQELDRLWGEEYEKGDRDRY